jgi:DNA-binding CsgD family transcriptional regulator
MPATTQLAAMRPGQGEIVDVPTTDQAWVAAALLLRAIVRDALGDPGAAERALQRALDLTETDQAPVSLLIHRSPGRPREALPHGQALTHGEIRVLHYLPTNLSAREIADELCLSVNTVKTHQRHLYQKLAVRSRTQAVKQARGLGLLGPSPAGPGESRMGTDAAGSAGSAGSAGAVSRVGGWLNHLERTMSSHPPGLDADVAGMHGHA